jgi:hypothetical protein
VAGGRERRSGDGIEVEGTRVSFGGETADHGCLVTSYAAVLRAVRNTRPGKPLQLRQADLEVLALAVGADDHAVETRIRGLLGCTAAEAKRIHVELVRRHLLRPVAMLAVGTAIVWGPAAAAHGDRPTLGEWEPRPETTAPTPAPSSGIPMMTNLTVQPTAPTQAVAADLGTDPIAADATDAAVELPGAEAQTAATATTVSPPPSTEAAPTTTAAAATPDVGIPAGETPTMIIDG